MTQRKGSLLPLWNRWLVPNQAGQGGGVPLPLSALARSIAIYGLPGSGKSVLIEIIASLIMQLRMEGLLMGIGVVDIHSDTFHSLKRRAAWLSRKHPEIAHHLYLIDAVNPAWTVTVNPLELIEGEEPQRKARMFADLIASVFGEDSRSTPRLARVLFHALWTLILAKRPITVLPDLILDATTRMSILRRLRHHELSRYFEKEFPRTQREVVNYAESVLNRMQLVSDPAIRDLLGSVSSSIRIRDLVMKGSIVLIHAPVSQLGESACLMLCAIFTALFFQAALSMATVQPEKRVPFLLCLDEYQAYVSSAITNLIAQARKFRMSVALSSQTISGRPQIKELHQAILNTVGSIIAFRVSRSDAVILGEMFHSPIDSIKATSTRWQRLPLGIYAPYTDITWRPLAESQEADILESRSFQIDTHG